MEHRRLASAVTDYTHLRGLLTMPVGALIAVAGLSNLQVGPFRQVWLLPVAGAVVAVVYWRLDRYYKDHFGRVVAARTTKVTVAVTTVVGVAAVVAGVQADWSLALPICLTAVAFSGFMLAYAAATVGLRAHHVAIWGGILVLGLVPLWSDITPDHKINVGLVVVGVATVISGWFDHVALTRSFGPAPNAGLGNTHAGG
jgi:hypothetical protein